MERQDFYAALQALYARLDEALPRTEGNPCGSCNLCCTARGLTRQVVSDLELDYLRHHGHDGVDAFRRYAAREEGEVCPYYQGGCTVYAHRPYACRTFGHYREEGTVLPEVCVFVGKERPFETRSYFATLPEARALHQLKRDYLAVRPPGPVSGGAPPGRIDLSHLDPDDPVDRAWLELTRGQYLEAEGAALRGEETPLQQMTLGLARAGQENWEGARWAFARAVELSPEAADLRYQLARALLELGDYEGAAAQLDRAVQLNEQHAPALSYRGYLEIARGNPAGAAAWLEKSLAVDPGQELVRQRLELVKERLS